MYLNISWSYGHEHQHDIAKFQLQWKVTFLESINKGMEIRNPIRRLFIANMNRMSNIHITVWHIQAQYSEFHITWNLHSHHIDQSTELQQELSGLGITAQARKHSTELPPASMPLPSNHGTLQPPQGTPDPREEIGPRRRRCPVEQHERRRRTEQNLGINCPWTAATCIVIAAKPNRKRNIC